MECEGYVLSGTVRRGEGTEVKGEEGERVALGRRVGLCQDSVAGVGSAQDIVG